VKATFTNVIGAMTLKLYDSDGNEVGTSTTTGNVTQIGLQGLDEGEYYAVVSGPNGSQGTYALAWDRTNYGPKVDAWEGAYGNNSIETAKTLPYTNGYYKGATNIHSAKDIDYFKVTLGGTGTVRNYFQMNSINASGALEMKLYDGAGNELRSGWSPAANVLDLSFNGLDAGTYYIKVSGVDGAVGSYNLEWNQFHYLPELAQREGIDPWTADKYEGNDTIGSAATLVARMGNKTNLSIHNAGDIDYYKITLTDMGTDASWVTASFSQITGKLDIALCNAAGETIRTSHSGGSESENYRRLDLAGLTPGTYYVKVAGNDGAQAAYSLYWNRTDYSSQIDLSSAVALTETNGTINAAKDVAYYAFNLADAGTEANRILVNSADKLQVTLLNDRGQTIHITDQGRINLSGLGSGDYYLKVQSDDILASGSAQYSISYDTSSPSSSGEVVMGTQYSSLFAINEAGTEYAYIMGYGNLSLSDFTKGTYPGAKLSYSNDLIIDAEKSVSNTKDNNQCWAATASNMLTWSGWAAKGLSSATGMQAEDAVFSEYSKYFPNAAGFVEDGVRWFFDGNYKTWSNSISASAGSGNYLQESALPGLTSNSMNGIVHSLHAMADALDNNMAVGLMMGVYSSPTATSRSSGHAVNVWGYTFDSTKNRDEVGYYTGLIITDSNDGSAAYNATDSADTLNIISLAWDKKTWSYYTTYGNTGSRVYKLENFTTLDHISNWNPGRETFMASAPATEPGLAAAGGTNLDALLATAVPSAADAMLASSDLATSSDKYKQNGMLTA